MPSTRLASLYLIFFLSGISGLIYQSVWSQYVKLMLGHAAYAQSFVLAVFMGGMALGAYLVSRMTTRVANPILAYAIIEAIIGSFGVLFHYEFKFIRDLVFSSILPITSSVWSAEFTKFSASLILLLPQAILLGATFPLMSAGVIRILSSSSGKVISTLYFSNSFGAALGALISGFILIGLVGLRGTTLTAGVLNLFVALIAWLISKQVMQPVAQPTSHPQTASGQTSAPIMLFLCVAFVTGFASFLYEIGWIRMLTLVLGGSVHAFEIMLSAFILGLAIGSLWIRKRIDTIENPRRFLGWVQLLMALMTVATLPLYTQSFELMGQLYKSLNFNDQGYMLFNLGSMLICMLVMLPATILAGMTLPLITHILLKTKEGEQAIGKVYAANTIGAIAGIIVAVNLLMPMLGVKYLIVIGGLCDFILGLVLIKQVSLQPVSSLRPNVAIILVGILFIFSSITPFNQMVLGSGVYRSGQTSLAEGVSTVFYQDGKTATVSVIQDQEGNTSIQTNGKSDALIAPLHMEHRADEVTMVLAAALPMLFADSVQNIANIGFGSGLTTHTLLSHPDVKLIDNIEIEQAMIDGARYFGTQVERAFTDDRSRLHIDDAKSFFSSSKQTYDIIVSEPSNPWVSGIAFLFTQEFYQHMINQLSDDGLFVQWLQLYETDMDNVGSVMKALNSVFPYYQLYNTDNANMLILAFKQKPETFVENDLFKHPQLASELKRIGATNIADLKLRLIGDSELLAPAFDHMQVPMNSDYYPFLSYNAAKTRFKKDSAIEITKLHRSLIPFPQPFDKSSALTGFSKHFDLYEGIKLAQNVIKGNYVDLPDKLKYSAMMVHELDKFCSENTIFENVAIESLYTIALSVNPVLDSDQLSGHWSELQKQCQAQGSNKTVQNWLSFYQALSERNFETIRDISSVLLLNEQLPQARHVLISAQLSALVTLNMKHELTGLLAKYQLLERYTKLPFDRQVLVSFALSKLG